MVRTCWLVCSSDGDGFVDAEFYDCVAEDVSEFVEAAELLV